MSRLLFQEQSQKSFVLLDNLIEFGQTSGVFILDTGRHAPGVPRGGGSGLRRENRIYNREC